MLNVRVLRPLSFLLIAIGAFYLFYSTPHLFQNARDYHLRWLEEHYVFRGKNPADVFMRIQAENHHLPVPETGRDSTVDKDLDPDIEAVNGTYPLYAYFTGAFLTWPPTLDLGRYYNGVLNLIVLAVLLTWIYRQGASEGPALGIFLVASIFAVNSIATTFIVGQYGLLVIAALVATALLDREDRWILAGICLAFAMIKPSVTAPFALPFLIRWRWKMLGVSGVYLVVATLIIWPIVKTSPLESMRQMGATTIFFEGAGYSLNNLFEMGGLSPQASLRAAAIVTLGPMIVLLWLWRRASIWTLYAIAAMGSRFWTYHRLYDNIILIFLLLPLAMAAWRTQKPLTVTAYLLFGISLWVPGRMTDEAWWIAAQVTIWVAALVVFLWQEPRDGRRDALTTTRDVAGVPA